MSVIAEVNGLSVDFPLDHRLFHKTFVPALRDVDLEVEEGEILGIVGESGSGKSTLARVMTGLTRPSRGTVRYRGATSPADGPRREVQMVFQDTGASLNPSMTVQRALAEVLRYHRLAEPDRIEERCAELMTLVRLPRGVLSQRPRELSGGQRQRVAIARALALEPEILIADEAVAGLDAPVRAAVINVLADLRDELGLTIVFISHDLALVRNMCDRVATMYLGTVVEIAPTRELFASPRHPYTAALLAAAPSLETFRAPGEVSVRGEPPNQLERPAGCAFAPRCPFVEPVCRELEPKLMGASHQAACHVANRPATTTTT